jgi:hypothetical protein
MLVQLHVTRHADILYKYVHRSSQAPPKYALITKAFVQGMSRWVRDMSDSSVSLRVWYRQM